MFEVIYNNKNYKVYSVRSDIESDDTDFLIYTGSSFSGYWMWVSCEDCEPVED